MKEVSVKTKAVQTRILNQVAEKVRIAVSIFTSGMPVVKRGDDVLNWKTVIVEPSANSEMFSIPELETITRALESFRQKYSINCYVAIKGKKVMVKGYEHYIPFIEINLRRDVA